MARGSVGRKHTALSRLALTLVAAGDASLSGDAVAAFGLTGPSAHENRASAKVGSRRRGTLLMVTVCWGGEGDRGHFLGAVMSLISPKSDRIARRGVAVAMEAFATLDFAFRPQDAEDYGIDAHAELVKAEHPTGRLLGIQLKSGPSYFTERQDDSYVFRADRKHVRYWIDHCLPVLVCLCDVDNRSIGSSLIQRRP